MLNYIEFNQIILNCIELYQIILNLHLFIYIIVLWARPVHYGLHVRVPLGAAASVKSQTYWKRGTTASK